MGQGVLCVCMCVCMCVYVYVCVCLCEGRAGQGRAAASGERRRRDRRRREAMVTYTAAVFTAAAPVAAPRSGGGALSEADCPAQPAGNAPDERRAMRARRGRRGRRADTRVAGVDSTTSSRAGCRALQLCSALQLYLHLYSSTSLHPASVFYFLHSLFPTATFRALLSCQ